MLKFYGYKKCSTCRNAEKYLDEKKIAYEFIDITEKAPSKNTLEKVLKATELEWKKLFNTSGVMYRELKIKDKLASMTKKEALELLSKNGKLVKRPIAIDKEGKAAVGFKEEFKNTFS